MYTIILHIFHNKCERYILIIKTFWIYVNLRKYFKIEQDLLIQKTFKTNLF